MGVWSGQVNGRGGRRWGGWGIFEKPVDQQKVFSKSRRSTRIVRVVPAWQLLLVGWEWYREVSQMHKSLIERQTLPYRSPECVARTKDVTQAIDMWSVGVVLAFMCGNPFTEVQEGELKQLVRKWSDQLGRGGNLNCNLNDQCGGKWEPSPWPVHMATVLGKFGMHMVSSLLAYNPVVRLSARGVLEHRFMTGSDFPLMGLCNDEAPCDSGSGIQGYGRPAFRPVAPRATADQSLIAGERHRWRIRVSELEHGLYLYIMGDDVFIEGTAANALVVELASDREIVKGRDEPRCVNKGPKTRIAGRLGTSAGVSMIGLCTKEPCPIARVIDFVKAFKKVNGEWLWATQVKCKQEVSRLGSKRRGPNGKHFLNAPLEKWFFSSAELTITDPCDSSSSSSPSYLVEAAHLDGGMSLFHGGLTLGGYRDLFCDVPGYGRPFSTNSPGTFYFGNLTGPRHQVCHRSCEVVDLPFVPGIGRRAVTVMVRTNLFPHNKSRWMERIPDTPALWACLKRILVESLLDPSIRLPTLEEVIQETRDRIRATAAATVHQPPRVAMIETAAHDVQHAKRRRISAKTSAIVTQRG